MILGLSLFLAAFLIALAILFFGFENIWAALFGPADQGRVVFKTMRRSTTPNDSLIVPQQFCEIAKPDFIAPIYELSAENLRSKMRAALDQERNLERVHTNDPAMRERYVQRTDLLRFPDTIQVEYVPISKSRSTVALYSFSLVGIGDHGVNKKRLKRWLRHVEKHAVEETKELARKPSISLAAK